MPNDPRVFIPGEPLGHAPWLRNVVANIQHRKIQVDAMARFTEMSRRSTSSWRRR
jgi:hypothetical protein